MLLRLVSLVLFAILSIEARAKTALIETESFTPGRQWSWIYSSLNKSTGAWTPYFREIYTVTERKGSKATITMRSAEIHSVVGEAHHKFVVDLAACERNQRNARAKYWTVVFFSKSLGAAWTVVSLNHKNLVFTEKFNCAPLNQSIVAGSFAWQGRSHATFQFPPKAREDASFYFFDLPGAEGVTAEKFFHPGLDYKMEFESVQQVLEQDIMSDRCAQ